MSAGSLQQRQAHTNGKWYCRLSSVLQEGFATAVTLSMPDWVHQQALLNPQPKERMLCNYVQVQALWTAEAKESLTQSLFTPLQLWHAGPQKAVLLTGCECDTISSGSVESDCAKHKEELEPARCGCFTDTRIVS
jgi:hypothetical protein